MDKLLDKYGTGSVGMSMGDKVSGRVIAIEKDRVIFDIGGKSEGLVAERAFNEAQDFIKTLKVGDEVGAKVLIPETPEGFTILSLRNASEEAAWKKILKAYDDKTPVAVYGKSVTSAGIMVDIFGLSGFIPNSQIGKETIKNKDALIEEVFKAKVIDASRNDNKIVLSEKEISEAEDLKLKRDALKEVKLGEIYDGVVTTVYNFGAFVKIEVKAAGKSKSMVPMEGLVHVSELSWDKVGRPDDVIREGDSVKVKVIDKKDGKLALSIKKTQDDPWTKIEKKYPVDKRLKGKVTRVSDFGVFVQLEPGVEGLIHMTKIPPGKKLKEQDEVSVYVEEADKASRRISLGLVLTQKPVGYR